MNQTAKKAELQKFVSQGAELQTIIVFSHRLHKARSREQTWFDGVSVPRTNPNPEEPMTDLWTLPTQPLNLISAQ